MKDEQGEVLETNFEGEPLVYLEGAGQLMAGLEQALAGRRAGERFEPTLPPELAYGERDPRAVHRVLRSQFPPGTILEVGHQFGARGPEGEPVPVWIEAVEGDTVVVDFNHPRAGKTLQFELELVE